MFRTQPLRMESKSFRADQGPREPPLQQDGGRFFQTWLLFSPHVRSRIFTCLGSRIDVAAVKAWQAFISPHLVTQLFLLHF